MDSSTESTEPKAKYKTYKYSTFLNWTEGRAGVLHSKGKPEQPVSSPPEFKGQEGVWTPEDLIIAAVDISTMTTFMAFAQHKNLPVVAYFSHADGVLAYVNGTYQFTEIVLHPTIVVPTESTVAETKRIIEDAYRKCLISNSITASVLIHPRVATAGGNEPASRENRIQRAE
jgi:organic hydroperoxide reductase OsmC/OhrA